MTENRKRFAEVYTSVFKECYPNASDHFLFRLEMMMHLIAKGYINSIKVDGKVFRRTAQRLGIKHTHTAFREYLSQ